MAEVENLHIEVVPLRGRDAGQLIFVGEK